MAKRRIEVGGKAIWVDSLLEEKIIRRLEDDGFAGRWERPEKGLHVGVRNYTPDVYLLIGHEGQTHRAIVEIKSVLHGKRYGFSDEIFQRMRIAAKVYYAKILLLYVDEDQTWYRIDNKTGILTNFGAPVPASKTIDNTYKPLTIKSRSIGNHKYNQRLDHAAANTVAGALEAGVRAVFGGKKPRMKRVK